MLTLVIALALTAALVSYTALDKLAGPGTSRKDVFRHLFVGNRFKTYILTTTCERECKHLTGFVKQGTFMLDEAADSEVAPSCKNVPGWDYQQFPAPEGYENMGPIPKIKFGPPKDDNERALAVDNPDMKFRTAEFQTWMEHVETRYRNKYAQTLRACSKGKQELCMLLEDDIVFINKRDLMLFRLALHTLPKYSGPEVSWDCAKKGSGWEETAIDGNKSQCRIIHRDYAGCLADYFDETRYPADVALAEGMAKCGMKQKWFLLVQHIGRKSAMGHDQ